MPQIIPIKDLRNTSEISARCAATNEPIFITKNGYGDMVVMSVEAYEAKLLEVDIYQKLMLGKSQADKGELLDGKEVMNNLRKKYVK